MNTDQTLNNYLRRLEKTLGPISVADKSEIVLEIKSHIDEAQNSGTPLKDVLSSLGEPETVANRYLLERGLQVQKAPKHPIVKWLTIGVLGCVGMGFLTVLILVWQFSPLVKVDEKAGRVQLLGGLIDVQDKDGKVKIGDTFAVSSRDATEVRGSIPAAKASVIDVKFTNGKADVKTSADQSFHWDCRIDKATATNFKVTDGKSLVTVDGTTVKKFDCQFEVPAGLHLTVNGVNGKIDFNQPNFHVNADIKNGEIEYELRAGRDHEFDFAVIHGQQPQGLTSKPGPQAIKLRARVGNGRIAVDAD